MWSVFTVHQEGVGRMPLKEELEMLRRWMYSHPQVMIMLILIIFGIMLSFIICMYIHEVIEWKEWMRYREQERDKFEQEQRNSKRIE